MMVGVLSKLAEQNPAKFYSSHVIAFMLSVFTKSKQSPPTPSSLKSCYRIGCFFAKVCKRCNPNIIAYPQLQSVANILVDLIENSKH
jgi:hypothetical protein